MQLDAGQFNSAQSTGTVKVGPIDIVSDRKGRTDARPARGVELFDDGVDVLGRLLRGDVAGTGGDGQHNFNISTAAALVLAGAGLKVAKHGNRSVSSMCGSADVVETLGINLDLTPQKVARCIDEGGIGLMFAQAFHPAMLRPRNLNWT